MTPKHVTRKGTQKFTLNGGKTMYYLTPLIDEFFNRFFNFPLNSNCSSSLTGPKLPVSPDYPVANIYFDNDGILHIELAVTGYSKDELNITIENDVLSIKGTKEEPYGEGRVYIHQKLVCRSFEAAYRISNKYDLEKLDVQLKNGLLKISAPLKPEVRPNKKVLEITES